MASVRVTYTISEETKKVIDTFKKESKLNISETIDQLLKFDEKSLSVLISLMSKKNKASNITIKNQDIYCTNDKNQIDYIRMLVTNNTSIDEEINDQNKRINNIVSDIENDVDTDSLEYKVQRLEIQLSDAQKNINNLTRVTANLLRKAKKD